MLEKRTEESKGDVWFVYDGSCPICRMAALALRIRDTVGRLHLVNAREEKEHPLMQEITRRGLNLDEGMVMVFGDQYFHGADVLHAMALLGTNHGWFNRMNALLFHSTKTARWCYPLMRAARNLLLRLRGVEQIRNLESPSEQPIFQSIFGDRWKDMPPVMQKHYAVRPYSENSVTVEGTLDIDVSLPVRVLARVSGMLVPCSGKAVPVTVRFYSGRNSRAFHFDRTFRFPGRRPHRFLSRMEQIKNNEVVELMRFGIGWRMTYTWDGAKVILRHRGYVWRLFGRLISIPLALVIGKGHAEEEALSDTSFKMWTEARHPWFGRMFGYGGTFTVLPE